MDTFSLSKTEKGLLGISAMTAVAFAIPTIVDLTTGKLVKEKIISEEAADTVNEMTGTCLEVAADPSKATKKILDFIAG